MNQDDLKKYCVIVENGSGCFFQPLSKEYTYILTAKHLFFLEKVNERGQKIKEEIPFGSNIKIRRHLHNERNWSEEEIPFQLRKGENYFPHKDANIDIALLKITPAIDGYDKIFVQDSFNNDIGFELCGCPEAWRSTNNEGDRYTNQRIERFVVSGNYCYIAQLFPNFNIDIIGGMSGGGILKILNDHISIIGVQSKMANSSIYPTGQIGFVPMKYFNEIIDYNEYNGKLQKILPPYLNSFTFLKDEIFNLKCGIALKNIAEKLTEILKAKAIEIQISDITPINIKNYLKDKLLLLHNQSETELQKRKIWGMWLELLTVLNIAKCLKHSLSDLPQILKKVRLFYSDINDDFWYVHLNDLCKLDYTGLEEGGVVVVASNIKAQDDDEHILSLHKIPENISRARNEFELEKLQHKIDNASDFPLEKYKYMNISAFKEGTVNHLGDEFSQEDVNKRVIKLKELYEQLISN